MKYFLLLTLLTLSACAPRPSAPPPIAETLKEALFDQLSENARSFSSLKGLAKMKITAGGRPVSGTQAIFIEKPMSLRTETMNPFGFGLPVMLMATDGQVLTVFVPSEGDYYRGEASPENLMRLFPVPLRVEDLVRFLLYEVPVIEYESIDMTTDESDYILTLIDLRGIKQVFRFDGERHLREMRLYAQEQLLMMLKYGSFEGIPPFPKVASLEMPPQGVTASVVYSDITLNTDIEDEKFILTLPEGVEEKPFP